MFGLEPVDLWKIRRSILDQQRTRHSIVFKRFLNDIDLLIIEQIFSNRRYNNPLTITIIPRQKQVPTIRVGTDSGINFEWGLVILLLEGYEKLLLLEGATLVLELVVIKDIVVDWFKSSYFIEEVFEDDIGNWIGLFLVDVDLLVHFSYYVLEGQSLVEE